MKNVVLGKNVVIGENVILGYSEKNPTNPIPTIIGDNVRIRSGSVIYEGCEIGNNSSIGHNTIIREHTIIGHDTYIGALVMIEGNVKIGNYVGLNAQCHITAFSIIEDYCFFGPGVISTNDKNMNYRRTEHGKNLIGFHLERFVRVGGGVHLLPAVNVGEGSIIGLGSVVTKSIPPYKVVIGNPARIVKSLKHETADKNNHIILCG